jgi:hypothetical protein
VFYYGLYAAGLLELAKSVKAALDAVGVSWETGRVQRDSGATSRSYDDSEEETYGDNAESCDNDVDADVERIPISASSVRDVIGSCNSVHNDIVTDHHVVRCVNRIQTMTNGALKNTIDSIARYVPLGSHNNKSVLNL